jgi:integrase
MPIHKLTPRDLSRTKPGVYSDGGGLYLQISPSHAKSAKRANAKQSKSSVSRSWVFRFEVPKPGGGYKGRWMGLGSIDTVGLALARDLAQQCRLLRLEGRDPIEERNARRAATAADEIRTTTFNECVDGFLTSHRGKWRGDENEKQWISTLMKYADRIIGKLPVAAIDTALVMKVLEQPTGKNATLWTSRTETADRLRGRIENVLDWAKVRGYREGENPARWRGHLDKLLPNRRQLAPVQHFEAVPYDEVPALMAQLRERQGTNERALEFLILCASRSGEVMGANWSEIDLAKKVWTVPAERMKSGKEHRVPLSTRAMTILADMREIRTNNYIFPGDRGPAITAHCMRRLLRALGSAGQVHGFRATFKTWASERTNFPREVIEAALAHTIGNAVENAYQRGDLFEKRSRLMTAWAEFCGKPAQAGAKVVAINKGAA